MWGWNIIVKTICFIGRKYNKGKTVNKPILKKKKKQRTKTKQTKKKLKKTKSPEQKPQSLIND